MARYSQIEEQTIQARLEHRYQAEIDALKGLGFRHLAYCLEEMGPYTALTQFPIIPLALLKKEILVIKKPLRLASANILLAAHNPPSIALCMGLGVKFYTGFEDGTMILSSNFTSSAVPRPGSRITRLPPQGTLSAAWHAHQKAVQSRLSTTDPLAAEPTFEHYVELSAIEEDRSQYIAG